MLVFLGVAARLLGVDGAEVSMINALLAPKEFVAPGDAKVNVALFPAASVIVPRLRANADVLT